MQDYCAHFRRGVMSVHREPEGYATAQRTPTDTEDATTPRVVCCGLTTIGFVKLCLVLAIIVGLVLAFTVGNLSRHLGDLVTWLDDNRLPCIFIFVSVYALLTSTFPSAVQSPRLLMRHHVHLAHVGLPRDALEFVTSLLAALCSGSKLRCLTQQLS